MRIVWVTYHHEDDASWAESEDVPGFTAVGARSEIRRVVREGLAEALGEAVIVRDAGFSYDIRLLTPHVVGYADRPEWAVSQPTNDSASRAQKHLTEPQRVAG